MHRAFFLLSVSALFGTAVFSQDLPLSLGLAEVRGSGGFNAGPDRGVGPSFGFEGAAGLNRFLALTADYAYSTVSGTQVCEFFGCVPSTVTTHMHEFMGGARLSVPSIRHFRSYAELSIGEVRTVGGTSVTRLNQSSTQTAFAIAPGGGLSYAISRYLGLFGDLRYVKPLGENSYVRTTFGLAFRFGATGR